MNKEKFLSEVTNRLSRQFHASKEGYRIADSERHRLEGFIQAGIFLQIATLPEIKVIMEDIHLSIFGVTIEQRNKEKSAQWNDGARDYEQYEIPTFQR